MSSGHEAARVAGGGRILLHLLGLALLAALWLLVSAARADADPAAPTLASQGSPVGDVVGPTVGPVLEAAPQPAPAGEQAGAAADAGAAVVERGGEEARSHVHRATEAATGAVTEPVRQAADEAPVLEPVDRVVHHAAEHARRTVDRTVDRAVDDTVATTSGAPHAVAGLVLSPSQSPSSSGAPVSAQRWSLQCDHLESLVLQRDSRTGAPSAEVIDTASGSFAAGVAPTKPAGHDGTPTAPAAYDVPSPAGGSSAGSGSAGHQASTQLLCVAPASAGMRTDSPTRAVAASDRLPRSRTIPHGSTPD